MFTVRHTTYNLRGTHMLTLSKPRTTTYGLHSFSYFFHPVTERYSRRIKELYLLIMILSDVCSLNTFD